MHLEFCTVVLSYLISGTEQSAEGPVAQPKRGQRAKLKKIKEKYADQDEEERRLRMEILGVSIYGLEGFFFFLVCLFSRLLLGDSQY